ncbi:hypothetical protein H6P81_005620 [Aristolochia fimbriata]|uniref:Serine/arginine repetitive matrix protein 1-like n=1 Tax=Aristolochia fimbriata TaxID=158543 RepID=A0AAV7EYP9_ARIFI|nr:hypothetical protein H6P81_005620 [Aristolochia fimbriata]
MGCCVSKKGFSSKGSAARVQGPENSRDGGKEENSREPPPAPQEEETVKEVLSETPKPPLLVIPTGEKRFEKEPPKASLPAEEKKFDRRSSLLSSNDETSEMSEICSLTESMSTTITEKKEENGLEEVEMRPRDYRSPVKFQRKRPVSGDYTGRRDRGGKSPARRSEPSPGRRTPGRERQTVTRSRIPNKKDPGEDSGRRSRSPAVRRDSKGAPTPRNELTRSASARKTGRAPRVVAEELGKATNPHPQLERTGEGGTPANESLENPLGKPKETPSRVSKRDQCLIWRGVTELESSDRHVPLRFSGFSSSLSFPAQTGFGPRIEILPACPHPVAPLPSATFEESSHAVKDLTAFHFWVYIVNQAGAHDP